MQETAPRVGDTVLYVNPGCNDDGLVGVLEEIVHDGDVFGRVTLLPRRPPPAHDEVFSAYLHQLHVVPAAEEEGAATAASARDSPHATDADPP